MRILVTGATGQVAHALASINKLDLDIIAQGRPRLDITDMASVERAISEVHPDIVVNAAAYTAVDLAEDEPLQAFAVNRDGAGNVALAAARAGLPVVHLSTDYVFAGDKHGAYVEIDPTSPSGVYGQSKLEGEHLVANHNPAHVILRTAWVYGPHGSNFVKTMLRLAAGRDTISVVCDQFGTPTYAPDIAQAILDVSTVMVNTPPVGWNGTYHLVSQGSTNWADFAKAVFERSARFNGPTAQVLPIKAVDYPTKAKRPANSRLSPRKFEDTFNCALPPWRDSLDTCFEAFQEQGFFT